MKIIVEMKFMEYDTKWGDWGSRRRQKNKITRYHDICV